MASFQQEDELTIITKCQEHARRSGIITCELGEKTYKVKYGLSKNKSLATRIANQRYLSSAAQNAEKIRIPNIVHEFKHKPEGGIETTYLVMEFIDLMASPPSDKDTKIENALSWLATVAPPRDHKLGPLGGGYIVHSFFKESEAPLVFIDVPAIERYMEKGRMRLSSYETRTIYVDLTDEPIIGVQGNMDGSHFGFDQEGNIVVMGLRSISFLPHSFGRYALKTSVGDYSHLPEKFEWLGDANQLTMGTIAWVLGMTNDTTLGFDEYGKEKKSVGLYAYSDKKKGRQNEKSIKVIGLSSKR